VDEHTERQAQRLAEHGARLAGEAGFEARALWVADERRIAATIVEGADELDADLIVMGARGLTAIAAFFGSVSNHVLQHASRPVLVVPSHKARTVDTSDKEETAAVI
jgi:nucleotide-binding universal stress UspA family protein